jgi:uncharacterized protein (TIGR03663 family)
MKELTTIDNPESEIQNPKWTVEIGLYAILAALALALRLYRLGLAPLSTNEAMLSVAALRGTAIPAGTSPLLYWTNALLFSIFGAGDALARLLPALAGSVLVLLPALMRERIGRVGALGAAALLAISPVAIITSRTVSGDALVAPVMLGLVVVASGYLHDRRSGWLYAGAALLGVGLASGRTIYSALLLLIAGAGVMAVSGGEDETRETWQTIRKTPGLLGKSIGVLVAVFTACATALMWQPGGLGAAINLLSAWVADFQFGVTAWYWPFQLLAVYEPLVVVAGLVGLFFALQRAGRFGNLLTAWLVMAVLLVVLRAGRTSGDVLLVVMPLALLSGVALETISDSLRALRFSMEEGTLLVILFPVITYLVLGLASYANNPSAVPAAAVLNLGPMTQLIQVALAAVFMVMLLAFFVALSSLDVAVRGATLAILAVLAFATWGAGWNAVQNHPGDPREIIAGPQTTSPAVRDLARDLAKLSADNTTDATTLPLIVQSPPDDVLAWYLRDLRNARFVTAVDSSSAPSAAVTTGAKPPALAGSYAGQRFALQREWRIEGRSPQDILKWLVFRRADLPTPTQQAILWVRQE